MWVWICVEISNEVQKKIRDFKYTKLNLLNKIKFLKYLNTTKY